MVNHNCLKINVDTVGVRVAPDPKKPSLNTTVQSESKSDSPPNTHELFPEPYLETPYSYFG